MKTGGAVFQPRAWSRWPGVVALGPVERSLCSGETLTSHRLGWSTPNSERPPLSSSGVFPSFHRALLTRVTVLLPGRVLGAVVLNHPALVLKHPTQL